MHVLIHAEGLLVNRLTGEILGYDNKPSIYGEDFNYQPELSRCRSQDDLDKVLEHIDRRKLPPHTLHSLISVQDEAHGVWRRHGVDYRITAPMMKTLEKLHKLVLYRNVFIMPQSDLAKALDTSASNLMKKLNVLINANLLRASTSRAGIRKGEIKITINPTLIFRGSDAGRGYYIEKWYQDLTTSNPESASAMNRAGLNDTQNISFAVAA